MKTIRQIADDLGVTRQAIYRKIKKEPLSTALQRFTVNRDKTVYIEKQGIELIQAEFKTTVDSKHKTTVDSDIVSLLTENLKILQGQLAEKDRQLADITAALVAAQQTAAAAQALHAGTIQQQLASPGAEAPADECDVASPKRRFFAVFGKRKEEK